MLFGRGDQGNAAEFVGRYGFHIAQRAAPWFLARLCRSVQPAAARTMSHIVARQLVQREDFRRTHHVLLSKR
jgi:hypothetical protein